MNPGSHTRKGSAQRGFTLVEMMMTITILAVSVAVILPAAGNNDRMRLIAATQILRSDIELAQVMTIAFPADPVTVNFSAIDAAYWLAYESDPDTALVRMGSDEPYVVAFGIGRAASAQGVGAVLQDIPEGMLVFNDQGGIADPTTQPVIYLTCNDLWVELTINPIVGTISETAGQGALPQADPDGGGGELPLGGTEGGGG